MPVVIINDRFEVIPGRAPSPAPARATIWLSYTCDGWAEWATAQEARDDAQSALDDEDPSEGWSEEVTSIRWGRFELHGQVVETDRVTVDELEAAGDDEGAQELRDQGWDYRCNHELRDLWPRPAPGNEEIDALIAVVAAPITAGVRTIDETIVVLEATIAILRDNQAEAAKRLAAAATAGVPDVG